MASADESTPSTCRFRRRQLLRAAGAVHKVWHYPLLFLTHIHHPLLLPTHTPPTHISFPPHTHLPHSPQLSKPLMLHTLTLIMRPSVGQIDLDIANVMCNIIYWRMPYQLAMVHDVVQSISLYLRGYQHSSCIRVLGFMPGATTMIVLFL